MSVGKIKLRGWVIKTNTATGDHKNNFASFSFKGVFECLDIDSLNYKFINLSLRRRAIGISQLRLKRPFKIVSSKTTIGRNDHRESQDKREHE